MDFLSDVILCFVQHAWRSLHVNFMGFLCRNEQICACGVTHYTHFHMSTCMHIFVIANANSRQILHTRTRTCFFPDNIMPYMFPSPSVCVREREREFVLVRVLMHVLVRVRARMCACVCICVFVCLFVCVRHEYSCARLLRCLVAFNCTVVVHVA